MAERKGISKKVRFEVFKRDSFTCQYCGKAAPDVILHVDHIQPVAKDGDNDITNLITSCFDCNMGKKDRELGDDAVIQKRKKQLNELQERREQLEMMVDWQRSLIDLETLASNEAIKFWDDLTPGWYLNEIGIEEVKRTVKRYGLSETLESMRICERQYLRNKNGEITQETVGKAFDRVGSVAYFRKHDSDKPYMRDLFYIKGILRNRGFYLGYQIIPYLEKAVKLGVDIDELKSIAIDARHWSDWRVTMETLITVRGGSC